jgi:hypothetical protein
MLFLALLQFELIVSAERAAKELNILDKKLLHLREVADAGVKRINHRNATGERRHNRPQKRELKSRPSRKRSAPKLPSDQTCLPDRLYW